VAKTVEERERVVVRFAGDSGDGMQLTGDRFTNATAILGNDLATLPDFPAEIRAPRGTLHGVSAFQIQFASRDILTPGDEPNVLVAMNPAALRTNIDLLEKGGTVIANEDEFTERNLAKAGYASNPLDDGSLAGYQLYRVPMESLTLRATEGIAGVTKREAERAKNFFALGLVSWMYGRPTEVTEKWIEKKFASLPEIRDANLAAFRAGWNFGETTELFAVQYEVKPAPAVPGVYRNVSGAAALAWGLIAASARSGLPLFYASYPITPASEQLHELSRHKNFGVRTVQAEDEIAAANLALGAAFGGQLGVTGTSGPGMDLKAETIGLAVALELPMVIVDVQRAGPSTGMPTKNEAADLLMAMHGRHGESPIPIVAACTPAQCFEAAMEAARIAITYRTPVILLSDTFLANSSEPWLIPAADELPELDPAFAAGPNSDEGFLPYRRDERLARPWAIPGTPGLEHRIGGLEKEDVTGNISYDPANHERMTQLRAAKVARIADDIPPLSVDDPGGAELLVLGWGSTFGSIQAAARRVRARGERVATAHLVHLNPFPRNLGDVLGEYEKILVPELNMGQLVKMIRADFLTPAEGYSKVQGLPFGIVELEREIERRL
jgi:2-oxoglutarate/2-oxoacid ferredoxin oxidoreductase subunit alpha